MKKRLISLLLTVLMVMSLFSGLTVSASADDGIIEYTMQEGDTVLNVCNSHGINFYTCKEAIMKLNNIANDTKFRFIPVGTVIKLPESNSKALEIISSGTGTSTGTGTGTSTGTTTNVNTTLSNGDSVAYYLIPITMQRGETVYTVCNALGIKFSTYSEQILKLNNLKSLDYVKAGQTLLFPSPVKPGVGVACYQVVAHKVTAGETAYSICNGSGVSYNGNVKLLQALNNKDNLNYITSGSTFYVPVSTVIAPESSTSGSTATGGTTTGGTTTGGSTTTGGTTDSGTIKPTTEAGKTSYALSSSSSTGGSVAFYVDGAAVTKAAAGDVVTIVPTASDGMAVKTLGLVYADGSAAPKLNVGGSFIMPACAVTATVSFGSGFEINVDSSFINSVRILVNGVAGYSAAMGDDVQIVSSDPALMVDGKISVLRSSTGKVVKIVEAGDAFSMPGYDVTIKLSLKAVDTYDFYKTVLGGVGGDFVLQVNGGTVAKAAAGASVTVLTSPATGYSVNSVKITTHDSGVTVPVVGNTFTMPAEAVDVNVSFSAGSSTITINPTSRGKVIARNGTDDTDAVLSIAMTGDTVYLHSAAKSGFKSEAPVVTCDIDGTRVAVKDSAVDYTNTDGNNVHVYEFKMPGGGATVTGSFPGAEQDVSYLEFVDFKVSTDSDANATTAAGKIVIEGFTDANRPNKIASGSVVTLDVNLQRGYRFSKFEVWVFDGTNYVLNSELTESVATNYAFVMPDAKIQIKAYMTAVVHQVANFVNTDICRIEFVDPNDYSKNIKEYKVGDTIAMLVFTKKGYTINIEDISVYDVWFKTDVKLNHVALTPAQVTEIGAFYGADSFNADVYTFAGPVQGFTVDVNTAKDKFVVSVSSAYPTPNDLAMSSEGRDYVMDVGRSVTAGASVVIVASPAKKAAGSTLVSAVVEYTDSTGKLQSTAYTTNNGVIIFKMPAYATTITPTFSKPLAYVQVMRAYSSFENCTGQFVQTGAEHLLTDTYEVGTNGTVIITANEGYDLNNAIVTVTGIYDGQDQLVSWDPLTGRCIFSVPYGGSAIKVELKKAETHTLYAEASTDGLLSSTIAGINYYNIDTTGVTVAAGSRVFLVASSEQTAAGKVLKSITYTTPSGTILVNADASGICGFTMPDANVEISAVFANKTIAVSTIRANMTATKCTVKFLMATDPLKEASEYEIGSKVLFTVVPDKGYILDSVVVTSLKDGSNLWAAADASVANGWSITNMPADGIKIVATATQHSRILTYASGSPTATVTANGAAITPSDTTYVYATYTVNVKTNDKTKTITGVSVGYTDKDGNPQIITVTDNSGTWSFEMPDAQDGSKVQLTVAYA